MIKRVAREKGIAAGTASHFGDMLETVTGEIRKTKD